MPKLSPYQKLILLAGLLIFFVTLPCPTQAAPPDDDPSREIAESPSPTSRIYTVKSGDTLARIALSVYGQSASWPAIYAANTEQIGPDPNRLYPGQVLTLPQLENKRVYACNGELMTLAEVADYREISLEIVDRLHRQRGLTPEAVCVMPQAKLDRAIYRVANPKPDHPGEAVAFRQLQLQDETGFIPPDGLSQATQQVKSMSAAQGQIAPFGAGISRTQWNWLGPGNIGGRVRSLLIHPTNPNLMWLGSVSGGIWRTTDGGASWQPVDDFMANLAVSTLAMHPANPNIIYAGTGEGFYNFDGIQGAGVFKSVDGGVTWAQLAATATSAWYYVNRLAIAPNNEQVLLAATGSGLYRTTTGGVAWSLVNGTEMLDVNFHPTNSNLAIASSWSGLVWYSTNGGQTWTLATGLPSAGRVEVAYAPSNPSIVYASVDTSGGQMWKSANGGQSYTLVNTGNAYLGSQGWYDNIIWVDPTDSSRLIVGGIDLWRSNNGGATLTQISEWWRAPESAHADHHFIIEQPGFNGTTNKTVFFTNDGGIYKTSDVYSVSTGGSPNGWQELNNNLGITQFYGAGGNPTSGVIVGGTQDNGTLRYNGNTEAWSTMFGGDGGFSAADPTNPNYFYGEYVYLQIHRSTDGGASANYIFDGSNDNANFIAPFILDPNNPNQMFGGGGRLWRSSNVKASTPTWRAIKPDVGESISAIAVAAGNSNIIWVGHNDGRIYKTSNGAATSPTWTQVNTNPPGLPSRYVTRLTVDPNNSNIVYATFGGFSQDNVWRTGNGGATWSDITGSGAAGLPDAPVRSLVIHPLNSNWLYVGTEIGVFASEDSGATWQLPHDGPANVSVDELFWQGQDLVAATHGRGLFKATTLPSLTLTKTASPSLAEAGGILTYVLQLSNTGSGDLTGVTLTDSLPTGVTYVAGSASNGGGFSNGVVQWSGLNIPQGASLARTFQVIIDPGAGTVNFFDDMETSAAWTPSNGVETNSWQYTQANDAYSGTHYWFVADIGRVSDSYLDSEPILIAAANPHLHFFHRYTMENGYDGGVVEVSVNGGPFTDVGAAKFVSNGYSGNLSANYENPLAGKAAFTGSSPNTPGYTKSVVNLSSLAGVGDTIKIRFRQANDSGVDSVGWTIEDVWLQKGATTQGINNTATAGSDQGAGDQASILTLVGVVPSSPQQTNTFLPVVRK
ncbi:MAG: DUF11 domain-containing protein [Anaerolineales bacterium]|nr:DUF11 domain-containing protein [Anaerolineales bacterium]